MMTLERLQAEVPKARVLVMTASEKAETLLAAVSGGAAGYITKRASRQELCEAVITVHGGGSVIAPHAGRPPAAPVPEGLARRDGQPAQPAQHPRARGPAARGHGPDRPPDRARRSTSPRARCRTTSRRIRDKTGLRRRSELTRWAVVHAVY